MDIKSVAIDIMKRAVDLDTEQRYTEALVSYQEGLQMLTEKIKGENDEDNKIYLRNKIEEHWNRVAAIKELIQERKQMGNYREQVHIKKDSTGHGYRNLFGRFLDKDVEYVLIEDPYIRTFHQLKFGLDYRNKQRLKAPNNKFCLGVYDLDLRQCQETKIIIVHSKENSL
ncbi:MIT domain-containing protein 1-like isoform X3 [Maniola jurtina]|uniref:MIT domain-containing protein 1-like isoform X3 n=1 Tax=Maniola jurtina TaxID=191418 RepID=UPI001E68F9F4|nr:MIT domain-containing protein 1-like isoform X3 [Maniola jurtina]